MAPLGYAIHSHLTYHILQKIQNIWQDLDAHPSESAAFSLNDGPKLIVESPTKTCMLDPVPTSLTKEYCLLSHEL